MCFYNPAIKITIKMFGIVELLAWLQDLNWPGALCIFDRLQKYEDKVSYNRALDTCLKYAKAVEDDVWESNLRMLQGYN